jgi:hypothetical protein
MRGQVGSTVLTGFIGKEKPAPHETSASEGKNDPITETGIESKSKEIYGDKLKIPNVLLGFLNQHLLRIRRIYGKQ